MGGCHVTRGVAGYYGRCFGEGGGLSHVLISSIVFGTALPIIKTFSRSGANITYCYWQHKQAWHLVEGSIRGFRMYC